jgi:hypothetical protein
MTTELVSCGNCKLVLNEISDIPFDKRIPCPCCGSTSRAYEMEITDTIKLNSNIGLKGKHPNQKDPFFEQNSGSDFWKKGNKFMDKVRIIDREKDYYEETIKDPKTGDIVYQCIEPLSKHTNHGSAKQKKRKNE